MKGCASCDAVKKRTMDKACETKCAKPLEMSLEEAQAFADAYAFLSLATRLPTMGLAEALGNGLLADAVKSMASDLGRLANAELAVKAELAFSNAGNRRPSLSELRAAYTELFTNPLGAKVMIHESLFRYYKDNPDGEVGRAPRLFVNPAALSVERIVREAGLRRSSESNESADHISTELELLGRLFEAKTECIHAQLDDMEAAAAEHAIDEVIREFVFYHVNRWHCDFFEAVCSANSHVFFVGLGLWGQYVTRAILAL